MDAVVFIGLNSREYYRELEKVGAVTDRKLAHVERDIMQRERDIARAMAEHNRAVMDRMVEDARHASAAMNRELARRFEVPEYQFARGRRAAQRLDRERSEARVAAVTEEQRLAKVRSDGLIANAALEARLDADRRARHERETQDFVRNHQRMANRTAVFAGRLDARGGSLAGSPGMRALRSGASALGLSPLVAGGSTAAIGAGAAAVVGIGLIAKGWAAAAREQEAYRQAQSRWAKEWDGLWSDIGQDIAGPSLIVDAAGRAVAALRDLRRESVNLLTGLFGGDGEGVDAARADAKARDDAFARARAAQEIEGNLFDRDPAQERRRSLNQQIEESGLGGTEEAARLRERLEAALAREAAEAAVSRAAESRAADLTHRARTATARAGRTERFDDDRYAAGMTRDAALAEAEARALADTTIPLAERHTQLLRDQQLIREEYENTIQRINQAEEQLVQRKAEQAAAEERRQAAAARDLAHELAHNRALAEGRLKDAERLRVQEDYERTLERINQLDRISPEQRAAMLADAAVIRDRSLADGPEKTSDRSLGVGLLGGDTLLRQIMGGSGQAPLSQTAQNTGKMVRLLQDISNKLGQPQAAVAV